LTSCGFSASYSSSVKRDGSPGPGPPEAVADGPMKLLSYVASGIAAPKLSTDAPAPLSYDGLTAFRIEKFFIVLLLGH